MTHFALSPWPQSLGARIVSATRTQVIELKLVKRRKTKSSTRKNVLDTSKGHITTNFNEKSLKMNDLNVLKEESEEREAILQRFEFSEEI